MVKVQMHFRTPWDSFWMEIIMIARLFVYFANFFMCKIWIDQVHVKIEMSRDVMYTFVFFVGTKKTITKMFKQQSDLRPQ
uniref:Uncharacterized protein n=1 Tax=Phlebotomus papatasi TaxID=29031 RepID=A0A1B0GQP7_PHLPP